MDKEEIRKYCLSKNGVTEGFPFNETALVFKVADKMFAVLDLSIENRGISLKCDPELAIELRETYPEVITAYHFNKKHWNGVNIQGDLQPEKIKEMIDHSYKLVVSKLPKKKQHELEINMK